MYRLAKTRGNSKHKWVVGAIINIDSDVKEAINNAKKLTKKIWLIGSGTYLEDVAAELLKTKKKL